MLKPYVVVRTTIADGKITESRVKQFSTLSDIEYWAEVRGLEFIRDKSIFNGYYINPRNGSSFEVHLNS